MLHPILYSLDSSGSTRTWQMESNGPNYRTLSGVKNGAIVVSDWTLAQEKNVGKKNYISAEDQAVKEVEAKYTKKLKADYFKTEAELGKVNFVQPMLAHKLKDYSPEKLKLFEGGWGIQKKLNGQRAVITKNGSYSRKGEKHLTIPHIENVLHPFFLAFPDAVLDGELFNDSLRQKLNELSSLVRKTKHITKEDLDKSEEIVQFHIYDGYGFDGLNEKESYKKRYKWLQSNLLNNQYANTEYIWEVPYEVLTSQGQLDNYYGELIEAGHEGVILRNLNGGYENKRSKHLLKHKPEDDSEAIILAMNEGTGNWSGRIKTFTLQWGDKVFDATLKGTFEEAEKLLQNHETWIGKTVTFSYNGLTGKNSLPNFAQIDYNNFMNHA